MEECCREGLAAFPQVPQATRLKWLRHALHHQERGVKGWRRVGVAGRRVAVMKEAAAEGLSGGMSGADVQEACSALYKRWLRRKARSASAPPQPPQPDRHHHLRQAKEVKQVPLKKAKQAQQYQAKQAYQD